MGSGLSGPDVSRRPALGTATADCPVSVHGIAGGLPPTGVVLSAVMLTVIGGTALFRAVAEAWFPPRPPEPPPECRASTTISTTITEATRAVRNRRRRSLRIRACRLRYAGSPLKRASPSARPTDAARVPLTGAAVPGAAVPGAAVPGGAVPGTAVPGGAVPRPAMTRPAVSRTALRGAACLADREAPVERDEPSGGAELDSVLGARLLERSTTQRPGATAGTWHLGAMHCTRHTGAPNRGHASSKTKELHTFSWTLVSSTLAIEHVARSTVRRAQSRPAALCVPSGRSDTEPPSLTRKASQTLRAEPNGIDPHDPIWQLANSDRAAREGLLPVQSRTSSTHSRGRTRLGCQGLLFWSVAAGRSPIAIRSGSGAARAPRRS